MVDVFTPIIFLTGALIGVSLAYLVDWLSEGGVIRTDVLELYEGDIDKVITKEVDDYGRLSVGTDLAGKRVRLYLSELKNDEQNVERITEV